MSETTEWAVPEGYTIRWPHKAYDLAKLDDGYEGAAWLVVCNLHGVFVEAATARDGDKLGGTAGRSAWCDGCAKLNGGQ